MTEFRRHTPLGATAYDDLVRMLLDARVSDLRGTPASKTIRGKTYWYDRFRIGTKDHWHYLGEDRPDLRARLARAEQLRAEAAERQAAQRRLVRVLRGEGYRPTDGATGSLLASLARIGQFRLGGTLVGTAAFRLYEGELAVRMAFDDILQTGDIDIASFERLSLALGDRVEEETSSVLAALDFAPVPALERGKVWRWQNSTREVLVEFLTPAFGDEGVRELPSLGVSAQALNYLNFLIAEPIPAVALYRSGVLVQIPRPERFAIHKLIVADRRREGRESLKARKDRAQAAYLTAVLAEDRPDELAEALHDARSRGPRWRERIERTLARMPQTRARLAALGD